MNNYIHFSISLICKKIAIILLLVFVFGACASQRHRPKPPQNKRGCDCPHFMQGFTMDNLDNEQITTIYDIKG